MPAVKPPFASRLTTPAATDLLQERECKGSEVPAKLRAIIITSFCLIQPVNAADPPKQEKIQVFISPECKDMLYGRDFVDLDATGKTIKTEIRPKPDNVEWDPTRAKPMAFKDPGTLISFYVESDGRHLAAIGPDGKLLWVRNPFEDRHLCPYRSPRPVIGHLAAAKSEQHVIAIRLFGGDTSHDIISVQFDSSQFGVIDEITGDFFRQAGCVSALIRLRQSSRSLPADRVKGCQYTTTDALNGFVCGVAALEARR